MAKLYYYYGAMGSSKTANALMTHFNYEEVGQRCYVNRRSMPEMASGRYIQGSGFNMTAFC